MDTGFVLLNRNIDNNSYFKHPYIFKLYGYLLLKANYNDSIFNGILVKRGSLITSHQKLSENLNITLQQVRTGLSVLEQNNFISVETTNKYSLINILHYDFKQESEQHSKEHTDNTKNNTENNTVNNAHLNTVNNNVLNNINKKNKKEEEVKYKRTHTHTHDIIDNRDNFVIPTIEEIEVPKEELKNYYLSIANENGCNELLKWFKDNAPDRLEEIEKADITGKVAVKI